MMERVREHKRKLIQLLTAVLYNSHISGFFNGKIHTGRSKGICAPGLNCYSCPGAVLSCPLGSLQGAIAKSPYKLPLYMAGMLMLFGILLGRTICGFLCPFGLLQELLYKIPTPKVRKSRFTRGLSYLKYLILAIFVIALPLALAAPAFCKYLCPMGTLEAGIPLVTADERLRSLLGPLFSWKMGVLLLILVLCLFFYRGFCRFLCPLGALYSFFNPVAFFGISVDREKCTGCMRCVHYCKMDVSFAGDHECICCGECAKICPEKAVSRKGTVPRCQTSTAQADTNLPR